MRRFDKKKNMGKANLLAEQRYLESKGIVNESFHDVDDGDSSACCGAAIKYGDICSDCGEHTEPQSEEGN